MYSLRASDAAVIYVDVDKPPILTQRTAKLMHLIADSIIELGDVGGKGEMDQPYNQSRRESCNQRRPTAGDVGLPPPQLHQMSLGWSTGRR